LRTRFHPSVERAIARSTRAADFLSSAGEIGTRCSHLSCFDAKGMVSHPSNPAHRRPYPTAVTEAVAAADAKLATGRRQAASRATSPGRGRQAMPVARRGRVALATGAARGSCGRDRLRPGCRDRPGGQDEPAHLAMQRPGKAGAFPSSVDRADLDGFADYLTSHSSYQAGVYSAPRDASHRASWWWPGGWALPLDRVVRNPGSSPSADHGGRGSGCD
jgi:hypothetical protein